MENDDWLEEPATAKKMRPKTNLYLQHFYIDADINKPNVEAWDTLKWLLQHGWVDNQIADYLGINRNNLGVWKRKYPELLQVIKENKAVADDAVEFCLYERATGYDFVETKAQFNKDSGEWETLDMVRHVPPDVQAQRYWLGNRRPDRWKDVVHNQNENKEAPMFDKSKLTAEQLDQLEKLLEAMS